MNVSPELDFIDRQFGINVMHFIQLGEASFSACQPLDPGPDIKVLVIYLLSLRLARGKLDKLFMPDLHECAAYLSNILGS